MLQGTKRNTSNLIGLHSSQHRNCGNEVGNEIPKFCLPIVGIAKREKCRHFLESDNCAVWFTHARDTIKEAAGVVDFCGIFNK